MRLLWLQHTSGLNLWRSCLCHLQERCELFKVPILCLVDFPARVYLPTQMVISQLRNIHCLALGLDSWGMVLPFLRSPWIRLNMRWSCHTHNCNGRIPWLLCRSTEVMSACRLLSLRLLNSGVQYWALCPDYSSFS